MKTLIKKIIVKLLEVEARLVLVKYKPTIIVIAGSVGKTSTKDAVYSVLFPYKKVRKSDKSYNSEFGVPLTILGQSSGLNNPIIWGKNLIKGFLLIIEKHVYPEILILEVGSDAPGDIDRIIRWLSSDIAILTRCPEVPVHVEAFGSSHELNEEDKKIIRSLKPDGLAILNADDEEIMKMRDRFEGTITTYGYSLEAEIRAGDFPELMEKVIGKQQMYPLLAAAAVAERFGIGREEVSRILLTHRPPRGRMNIIEGLHETRLIDDTYNSSPIAVEEALNVLATMEGLPAGGQGRKIAVLGDMLELGKFTIGEHRKYGAYAATRVDALITVGQRAKDFAVGAREAKMHHSKIHSFNKSEEAAEYLLKHMHKGDTILIKGSQGVRMERIVKALMREPEKAAELLVRQEKEWQDR